MDPVERFDADFAEHARQFRRGLAEIGRPFPNNESADCRHRILQNG